MSNTNKMDDIWEALIEISKTQVLIANTVLRLERELIGPERPQQEPSPTYPERPVRRPVQPNVKMV